MEAYLPPSPVFAQPNGDPTDEPMEFTIALATSVEEEVCPLCGQRMPAVIGPALFVAGTGCRVCPVCGQQHAPELAALLELAQLAETLVAAGH